MDIEHIAAQIPDYAKDLRLNLAAVLSTQGAAGLNERQVWSIALASAIASRNVPFAKQIEALARGKLDEPTVNAAKSAASIMGMNNIYYRFVHLVDDKEYQSMPARLRMNILANPGIDKTDFELLAVAVSAVNGCGMCVSAHDKTLRGHGVGREAIQSAVRIASVMHATAGVLEYAQAA
jgi:lipoyl-dependent peroxiredoxin subunit D